MTGRAPISGTIPPDYSGPIFYRLRVVAAREPKPTATYLKFANLDAARRLAAADPVQVAHRRDPRLFDQAGNLLDVFRRPINAEFRASAPKSLAEWSLGSYAIVSARVREAIDRFQPGKHLFIPIDVAAKTGLSRLYAFYVQRDHIDPALAQRANADASADGRALFAAPTWITTNRFGYLRAGVVEGVAVDWDARLGFLISEQLAHELGDAFAEGVVLIPMGVVDEPVEQLR